MSQETRKPQRRLIELPTAPDKTERSLEKERWCTAAIAHRVHNAGSDDEDEHGYYLI